MPTERLSMRRIRDLLRLKYARGLSERAIALSLGLGKGTVGSYLARARQAGLSWPLPAELDDDSLELLLFPSPTPASRISTCARPVALTVVSWPILPMAAGSRVIKTC